MKEAYFESIFAIFYESWVRQYLIKFCMNHSLEKFKDGTESERVLDIPMFDNQNIPLTMHLTM